MKYNRKTVFKVVYKLTLVIHEQAVRPSVKRVDCGTRYALASTAVCSVLLPRCSYASETCILMSICPSVFLSVCLSNAWIVTKRNKAPSEKVQL